jgi:hypothetical protein
MEAYKRYAILTEPAPNVVAHPNLFRVKIRKPHLAAHLLRELVHRRGDLPVVTSRPCIYGVFSGPIGGFAPRPQFCVGCLRCTVEHHEITEIRPNPSRLRLGDSYFTPDQVDTIVYEASTGHVPVRGAGYRGRFGGPGWDGMWTDMSEIGRPTRDGIHGREFISTTVDIGEKPAYLKLSESGEPLGELPRLVSIEVPMLLDRVPASVESLALYRAMSKAAYKLASLAIVPMPWAADMGSVGESVVPLVAPSQMGDLAGMEAAPRLIELDGWDAAAYDQMQGRFPEAQIIVRISFVEDPLPLVRAGVRLLHLTADYHGRTGDGFVLDAIRRIHDSLVSAGVRELITLLGSGGIIAADHVAKAIVCGLDVVALDTPLLVSLQAAFHGECIDAATTKIRLPSFREPWAVQRLLNLFASWRDQMLEILGAMGLREVRRLRGEIGRAMFQRELAREAFADIAGYED